MILNEIGVIGQINNTQCKANKRCDEIIDENTEFTKRLAFTTEVKEHYRSCTEFLKGIQNQKV